MYFDGLISSLFLCTLISVVFRNPFVCSCYLPCMIISSEENLGTEEGTEDPEDYTDDNDDYNSILRPAFEVDGEPDFSTGPPEDGLEYLRRVRYIISLFPSFCVFTLLNFWYYG